MGSDLKQILADFGLLAEKQEINQCYCSTTQSVEMCLIIISQKEIHFPVSPVIMFYFTLLFSCDHFITDRFTKQKPCDHLCFTL